jgi:hypothetical protein
MKMPDITLAQIVAVIGAIFGMTAAFGLPVSQEKQEAIIGLITVLAPVLIAADAAIRHGRSRVAAAKVAQEPLYESVVDEG